MKKFRFRLQKVLEYRRMVKDERLKVLVEKNLRVTELEDERDRITAELDKEDSSDGTQDASLLELGGLYRARMRDKLVQTELDLIPAREEQEEALARYHEAAKDEEALQNLKDRKEAEYWEYILKEDEKFLDELAVLKGNTLNGE